MQETWVQSLGQEDSLEEGTATHSSILAWRIPRTEEPGWLSSIGSQRVRHDWSNLVRTHSCYTTEWLVIRTHTYMCNLFHILFRHGLSQDIERSFPCYPAGPCSFSLHVPICTCEVLHSPFGLPAPPLSPHLLPSLAGNRVHLLLGTQGRSWRLNDVYFLQTRHWKGDTERLLCPGVLEGLAWFQTLGKNQTISSRETEISHLLFTLCITLCRGYFYPHCSEMRKHWPWNLAGVTHLIRWLGSLTWLTLLPL